MGCDANTALDLVCAFQKLQVSWQCDLSRFAWTFRGPDYSVQVLADFWKRVIQLDFLRVIGFEIETTRERSLCKIVGFCRPENLDTETGFILPAPIHQVCIHLMVEAAKQAFAPLNKVGDLEIEMKIYGRTLWKGMAPAGLTIEHIMMIVDLVSFPRMDLPTSEFWFMER